MFKHVDFLQNDWTLQLRKNWIPKVERKLKQKTGRKESPLVKEHSQGSIPCPIGNISGIHDIFLEAIAGSSRKCWLRCYLWSECQCSRGWSDAISFTSNFKFKMWTLIKDSNNLRSYEEHPRQIVGVEFLVCSYSVLSPHKVSFFGFRQVTSSLWPLEGQVQLLRPSPLGKTLWGTHQASGRVFFVWSKIATSVTRYNNDTINNPKHNFCSWIMERLETRHVRLTRSN